MRRRRHSTVPPASAGQAPGRQQGRTSAAHAPGTTVACLPRRGRSRPDAAGRGAGERDERHPRGGLRVPSAPRGPRPLRGRQADRRGRARARAARRRQAGLEREPARPVAARRGGRPRGARRGQPLPGPAGDRAAPGAVDAPRRAGRADPGRQRVGRDHRPGGAGAARPRRQRGHLRARLRALPPDRGRPQPRRAARADARLDARSQRDGRGDRRAHAARVRRQPEQPDRHLEPARASSRRWSLALPPALPAGARRGVLRVRGGPGLPRRHRARAPRGAGARDADVLEGLRPRRAARGLRGGRTGGARRRARDPRGLRHQLGRAGRRRRGAPGRRARAALGAAQPPGEAAPHARARASGASRCSRASPTS